MLFRRFFIGACMILGLSSTGLLTGCSTNPATGKMQFNMMSEEEEIQIGSQAAPGFIQEGGGDLPDQQIQSYVSGLGQRLAAVSERPDLPWEFHVLNSPIINAFALPGGKVFITRGLMERMENEAQLAGVLGHEIGHVTAQHIGQQMSRAMGLQIGLSVIGAVSQTDWINTLGGAGGQLYLLKFGRDQESQADSLGLRYMTKLNYDPMAQVQVMHILREAAGGGGGIEMMQTHPLPDTRIERVTEEIKTDYAATQGNPQYSLRQAEYQPVKARLASLPPAPQPKQAEGGSSLRHRH